MVLINQFINFKIGGVTVSATSSELNYNAGVTAGTATAEKTLVLDSNKDITGINELNATTVNTTIGTASQPNITSLGTLTTLDVSGNTEFGIADSGMLQSTFSGNNAYLQPSLNTTLGSATHLFITNRDQDTSSSARVFSVMSDGRLGVQSINPSKQVEINSSTGDNLRLTYNDMNGTATDYVDFSTDTNGDLTITTSGEFTTIAKKLLVTDAISNFSDGGLIARAFNNQFMLGRVIQQEVITSLNITDYNPTGITDNFSVEIYGYIKPLYTQTYTFYVTWNNGCRLFINGEQIFNKWHSASAGTGNASSTISLTANTWYPIYIQNYDSTGAQLLRIEWESTSQIRQDIPSANMGWSDKEPSTFMNLATGDQLTLFNTSDTYTSIINTKLSVDTSGDLTIDPSGTDIIINSNCTFQNGSGSTQLVMGQYDDVVGVSDYMFLGYDASSTPRKLAFGMSDNTKTQAFIEMQHENNVNDDVFISFNTSSNNSINATEKMRLTHDGKLGIGTTTPEEFIHIKSTSSAKIKLEADSDNVNEVDHAGILFSQDNGLHTGFIGLEGEANQTVTGSDLNSLLLAATGDANHINFAVDGSVRAKIHDNGTFGINTSDTTGQLVVQGTSIFGNVTTGNSRLRLIEASGIMYFQSGSSESVGSAADFAISNYQQSITTSSRRFIVKADGKVGIQTNVPSKQLDINSSTGNCLRLIYNDNNGLATNYTDFNVSSNGTLTISSTGDYKIGNDHHVYLTNSTITGTGQSIFMPGHIFFTPYTTSDEVYIQARREDNSGSTNLNFRTTDSGTLKTPLYIKSNGNVGIGTTTPGCILEVQDTAPEIRLTDDRTSSGGAQGLDLGKISWYSLDGSAPDSALAQIRCTARNSTVFPDGDIRFRTGVNGVLTDAMIVTATNEVGIGIDVPDSIFHVYQASSSDKVALFENNEVGGCSYIDIQNEAGTRCLLGAGGSGLDGSINDVVFGNWSSDKILFNTNGANTRMTIDGANVGIGTKTPDQLLHIKSAGPALLKIEGDSDNTNEADTAGILISQDGGGTSAIIKTVGSHNDEFTGTTSNSLVIGVDNSATSNHQIHFATDSSVKMTLDRDGHLGIGTNNPSYEVDIQATGENAELRILRTDSNGVGLQIKSQDDKARLTYESSVGYFQIDKDNIGTLAMMFDSSGNIGINEFSPHSKLHITNTSPHATNSTVTLESKDSTNGSGLSLDFINNTGGSITSRINNYRYGSSDYGLVFSNFDDGLYEHMVLRNKNVGIGTNNPTEKLEVNGNILINSSSTSSNIYIKSTTSEYRIFAHSDAVNYHQSSGDIFFKADGINETFDPNLYLSSNGRVGMGGIETPLSLLHIKQETSSSIGGIKLERSDNTDTWAFFTGGASNLEFVYNGSLRAYLLNSSNVGSLDFTGQHRNITDNEDMNDNIEDYIGLIVYATGEYQNMNNGKLHINEALPKVELTNIYKDKRVFGVVSNKEDVNSDRIYEQGAFATAYEKIEDDERLIINSVGEGMIWVCDKNGAIENGDLITSCEAAGYGCKQNTVYICNYSVGKITQDCDFLKPERYVDLEGYTIDKATYDANPDNGYKCCFVGCVYYCG